LLYIGKVSLVVGTLPRVAKPFRRPANPFGRLERQWDSHEDTQFLDTDASANDVQRLRPRKRYDFTCPWSKRRRAAQALCLRVLGPLPRPAKPD
jgi:hypothetical protein